MAELKLCPLIMSSGRDDYVYCRKEKCEWWHVLNIQTGKGRCSILTIAAALHWISVKEVK